MMRHESYRGYAIEWWPGVEGVGQFSGAYNPRTGAPLTNGNTVEQVKAAVDHFLDRDCSHPHGFRCANPEKENQ